MLDVSACFVVSPEGHVVYAHYHKDSADNPPVSELLDAVRDYTPSES
jgi:hypothetical protein